MESTDLKEAMAQARVAASSDSEADSLLKTLFAEEGERVAEAIAFAEVLVPMLAERLNGRQGDRSPSSAAGYGVRRAIRELPGETRGIADFIDDMLAQDRTHAR